MTGFKVGDRVRDNRTLDWGRNWQDCTITGLPSAGSRYFDVKSHDGRSGMMAADEMEIISNATPHPAPSPSEVGQEVVERMIALVRRVAGSESFWVEETEAEARAIVALLPEPVDADEQYARNLIREQGWEGEQQIGAEAVVRMIAVAHRSKGE